MNNAPVYPTYLKAILALSPNAEIAGIGENLDSLVWAKNPDNITNEQIETKFVELQAEYDAKQYQRDRAADYPSWQEQMDLLYHGGVDALKAELKKTKDKFPKPE